MRGWLTALSAIALITPCASVLAQDVWPIITPD